MTTGITNWEQALALIPATELAAITEGLDWYERNTSGGRNIVRNLREDRFIEPPALAELLKCFSGAEAKGKDLVLTQYRDACRSHVFKGGPVGDRPLPARLGRAVEIPSYIQRLMDANRGRITRSLLDRLIHSTIERSATHTQKRVLRTLNMSEFGVWVTWDKASNGHTDPFNYSGRACADEVRANLGLPMEGVVGTPLFLIRYKRRPRISLLRPTCADAELHFQFEPPPPGENRHGLTKPWATATFDVSAMACEPRPEAIHNKILFSDDVSIEEIESKVAP